MLERGSVSDKFRVQVKPVLMELVPAYMKRRHEEVARLREFVAQQDAEGVRMIGHKLSGNASTYGFHELSRLGMEFEFAAKSKDFAKIGQLILELADYLEKVEVSCVQV
jgi:HPt (histidine-containing phosphotransfer) domain-containing protein